jgi:hypothetical protein
MTATAPRPRTGFLHRFQCARSGHHWERQLAGERASRALDVPVRQALVEDEDVDDPSVYADSPANWTAPMSEDEVDDVVHAGDVPRPQATRLDHEPEPEPEDRRSPPSRTPTLAAVAAVSLAVAGGAAYLAFRRRRRHR